MCRLAMKQALFQSFYFFISTTATLYDIYTYDHAK